MDESGLAGAAAVFGAAGFYYGIRVLYAAIVYARLGILNYPALIVGGAEVWAAGGFALAAGSILQNPPHLPDFNLLAVWTAAICCVILAIVFLKQPEVHPGLELEAKRVGLGVLIPMIVGAVLFLGGIAFYARI